MKSAPREGYGVAMVRKPLEMALPDDLCGLARHFEDAGHRFYLVGGAVRDAVMGQEPKDFDVATDATPDRVIELTRSIGGWSLNEVGKSFGVVRARSNDHEYEIATFRQDIGEGRRPEAVVFTSIEEDVKRRDLTINALFYDIVKGEVVDLVGGLDDISAGIIRTVGRPKDRFREDRLRVLRALRFASRYRWALDQDVHDEIDRDNNLNGVSPERVRDEFIKGLAKNPNTFIANLDSTKMWQHVFPGLDVVAPLTLQSTRVPVVLSKLLRRESSTNVARRLNALKYTSTETAQTSFLLDVVDLCEENAYRLAKRRWSMHVDDDTLRDYNDETDHFSPWMLEAFLRYRPSVSGDDLLAEGLSGAELGRELERRETVRFKQLLEE